MFMISRRTRTLQSPKYLQKKRKKTTIKVFLSVAGALAILAAFVFVLRLSFFQITTVKLEKPGSLPASELEAKALAVTQGNYLYVIPRSFSFFYPKGDITAAVTDAYKKIDSMRVVRKSFSTLEITVSERVPEAIVCEGFREEDEMDECFFADKDGLIFTESPGFSDGVYSRYYVNSESNKLVLGENFVKAEQFHDLQNFVKSVRANNISTLGILIGDAGSYELYVKNKDQSTAVVYFDDRTPFEKTMSNLIAFWDNTKAKGNFDYINLRFGNNIFYTLK